MRFSLSSFWLPSISYCDIDQYSHVSRPVGVGTSGDKGDNWDCVGCGEDEGVSAIACSRAPPHQSHPWISSPQSFRKNKYCKQAIY